MSDKADEELSSADWKGVIQELDRYLVEGNRFPSIQPSLLGVDSFAFRTRKLDSKTIRFMNPPEFIFVRFTALDAYATAFLATSVVLSVAESVDFSCSLVQPTTDSDLHLEFETIIDHEPIPLGTEAIELLRLFPKPSR